MMDQHRVTALCRQSLPVQRCCFRPPPRWMSNARLFGNHCTGSEQLSDANGNDTEPRPPMVKRSLCSASTRLPALCQSCHNTQAEKTTLSVKSLILHTSIVLYYFWARWILRHSLGRKKKANSVNASIFTAFAKFDIFQSNCEKHAQSLPTAWFSSYKIPLNQTHFEIKRNLLENFIALLDTYSKINHLTSFCIPGVFLSWIFFFCSLPI